MFLDASAIVAILTRESGFESLVAALEGATSRHTSGIAIFEAALGVRRKRRCDVAQAEQVVMRFLAALGIEVASIGAGEASGALDAFARFGKGAGHPAQLNMGDCFAYAVARSLGAPLLFTGDDFARTDVNRAAG